MAHTKAVGTTKNGRDSQPKYLGVKLFDGQVAKPGSIIVRQRGSKILAGQGTRMGNDDTIYADTTGKVKFQTTKKKCFDGSRRLAKIATVVPSL